MMDRRCIFDRARGRPEPDPILSQAKTARSRGARAVSVLQGRNGSAARGHHHEEGQHDPGGRDGPEDQPAKAHEGDEANGDADDHERQKVHLGGIVFGVRVLGGHGRISLGCLPDSPASIAAGRAHGNRATMSQGQNGSAVSRMPQRGKEARQVVRVVLDMRRGGGGGGHMHGLHPHRMRRGQVARIVLEHRRLRRADTGLGKDRLEGAGLGLGMELGILDAEHPVEKPAEPARREHPMGIGRRAVGEDDLAPGQIADRAAQCRIGAERVEGDVVHLGEVGHRVEPVLVHQPGERGAVKAPVMVAQPVRLAAVDAERAHDIFGHLHLDLGEETGLGRVQGVVEVEHPVGDMCEICG
ncbi:hypothetical protein SDC9_41045 [bioreactor metagenome]|uniref:Uncharacterized protein n=1 Tax=bioreactor metagenome TaxID=1076179 RepID=A0A644VU58_9ZZZZ